MIKMSSWAVVLLAAMASPAAAVAGQVVTDSAGDAQIAQTAQARSLRAEQARTAIQLAATPTDQMYAAQISAYVDDLRSCAAVNQRTTWVGAFNQGNLRARECAVRLIQRDTFLGADYEETKTADYEETKTHVGMLETFYSRRAQRQQTFLDVGSLVTIIGAAGAFEGGISDTTRRSWVIAGVLPSVVGRFNTYEPTRELFQGGALAVHLITLRHDRFNRALSLLVETPEIDCTAFDHSLRSVSAERRQATENKNAASVLAATAVSHPTDRARKAATDATTIANATVFDPEGVLLAESRRLRNTCYAMKRRALSVKSARLAAAAQSSVLANDFANDVLSLDRALIAKDRDLRYTPIETLTAVVASPLRALDALVSGEDSKIALDSLKTQIAFSGINRSLASIPLPSLAAPADALTLLEPVSVEASTLNGGSALMVEIENLQRATDVLASDQQGLINRERWAADLFGAAQADYLAFTYDVATGTTTVTLGAAPVAATITGTTAKP